MLFRARSLAASALLGGFLPGRPERIVLVTLDTVRADHLSCYGYPVETTPFLDRLARTGVRFSRAFCSSPQTSPSHASLLTSLYPTQHGLETNKDVLDPSVHTLPELLAAQGYRTAGFASVGFIENVGRGFDAFGTNRSKKLYRIAHETVDEALAWLERCEPSDRFFLWVHLFDAHEWRRPPYHDAESLALVRDRIQAMREQHLRFLAESHGNRAAAFASEQALLDAVVEYDARIRSLDREVERLYAAVESRFAQEGGSSACLWIVTADHGEGLGSHGYRFHGENLYNEQLRVPLILHFTDGQRTDGAGAVIDELVRHVDVAPTVAELVGARLEQPVQLEGLSLLPLLEPGGKRAPADLALSHRWPLNRRIVLTGESRCIQSRLWKYIDHANGPDEVYDLARDPLELANLDGEGLGGAALEFKRAGLAFFEHLRHAEAGEGESADEARLRELRALGYADD